MGRVIAAFRELLNDTLPPAQAPVTLDRLMPGAPCDGYWIGEAGMAYRPDASSLE